MSDSDRAAAPFGSTSRSDAVRVIAGRLGGRSLVAPKGNATRPTSDRVREALFQVLGDLTGARVADLYAGTGALGIEALSRGAVHVVFVEKDRRALAALRKNLAELALDGQSTVLAIPLERATTALASRGPYDLLLADPPWADLERAVGVVARALELVAPDGRVVLEHAARDEPPALPPPFTRVQKRTWGDTAVSIYEQQDQGMA